MAYCPLAHGSPSLLQNPTLTQLAEAHKTTAASVALRWSVQRGFVPLPKASSAKRLASNLAAAQLSLSDSEMLLIDGLEADDRCSFDPRNIA